LGPYIPIGTLKVDMTMQISLVRLGLSPMAKCRLG